MRDRAGWLWIATKGGLIARKPTGEIGAGSARRRAARSPSRGSLVELRRAIAMLVIGADAEGHERIAIGKQLAWVTYRALPEVRVGRGGAARRRRRW